MAWEDMTHFPRAPVKEQPEAENAVPEVEHTCSTDDWDIP